MVTWNAYSLGLGGLKSNKGIMLQDVLRLLTLWFTWGHIAAVQRELRQGIPSVDIVTWQLVIPQLIARIHLDEQTRVRRKARRQRRNLRMKTIGSNINRSDGSDSRGGLSRRSSNAGMNVKKPEEDAS